LVFEKKKKFFLKLCSPLTIIHSVEDKEVDDRDPKRFLPVQIKKASRMMLSQSQGGQK